MPVSEEATPQTNSIVGPGSMMKVRTITAKGQTTVPEAIRQALGVSYVGTNAWASG